MSDEFSIIKKYFTRDYLRQDLLLSIGDDAAIVSPPADHDLVFTMDTLVVGVHFPVQTSPFDIGYKTAAVNLSDLAAMGAQPLWATLALTLPKVDEEWLNEFSHGLFTLLDQYKVALIGGDTTRGPLCITLQAHGCVPRAQALRRGGAKPGDLIYVSGTLGDAGLALQLLQNKFPLIPACKRGKASILPPTSFLMQRLNRPTPRVELGLLARDYAHAAIDISDGLAQDLSHILERSNVGAEIELNKLPLSEDVLENVGRPVGVGLTACKTQVDTACLLQLALTAGDDYELCLAVPAEKSAAFELAAKEISCPVTCIGKVIVNTELIFLDRKHEKVALNVSGYQHF